MLAPRGPEQAGSVGGTLWPSVKKPLTLPDRLCCQAYLCQSLSDEDPWTMWRSTGRKGLHL
jgi:hypothetical protein